jgi:hypothetical protein
MKKSRKRNNRRNPNLWWTVLAAGALLAIVAAFVFNRQWDIRGKAAQETPGNPTASLPAPSLRLKVLESSRERIDVGVYINTDGVPTAEADAVIAYDPNMLSLGQDDIELKELYRVKNVEHTADGMIELDMFVSDSIDNRFVSATSDTLVALLHFRPSVHGSATQITLRLDSSGIYPPRSEAGGAVNILTSVEGVSFQIE